MTREVEIFNEYSFIATFTVSLERKSTFMVVNIILPIVFLAAINLLVFVLPPEAGERVSLSVTILMSLAVFMTLVGDNLPKTSDPLPVLSYDLLTTMTISTLMCVMAILNLAIYYKNEQSRPSKCIAAVAATVVRRKTDFNSLKVDDTSSKADCKLKIENRFEPLKLAFENNKDVLLRWKDVSYVVDILCFVGFLIGLCSINIYYIVLFTSH
ncbi:neuronal acetylcholine receptor subunit alpha-6-like [Mya arenaria]|uniref:neuronal acetylcholine receptor subunit alpha-6-like n=1 Tax=Mya arenaria TaxID=6604 RepID=UPI0022E2E8D8|nr:neuronal acetylcholine receptor subunit alpha-6-like [Mya arenaria]